jgi:hypothetical protein
MSALTKKELDEEIEKIVNEETEFLTEKQRVFLINLLIRRIFLHSVGNIAHKEKDNGR